MKQTKKTTEAERHQITDEISIVIARNKTELSVWTLTFVLLAVLLALSIMV